MNAERTESRVSALPGAVPDGAPVTLDKAHRHCAEVTRRSGSSFAAAFWMLSPERRRAIHAVYAFCRVADDIADDAAYESDRAGHLAAWRRELERAYLHKAEHPVGVALADTVHRFRLPEAVFQDLLRGFESDLRGDAIRTFEDLRLYCYRVASTVGLLVVRILGARSEEALAYAESLGIAVQLTNVLRDVGEDAAEGRIYLPSEDLARFGIEPEAIFSREMSEGLRLLLACTAERAEIYYERAARALPRADARRLHPAEAMGAIYRALLAEIRKGGFACFGPPVRLSKARRLALAAATLARGRRR